MIYFFIMKKIFKTPLIVILLLIYSFISISSGSETHLCIHESGHISFESIEANGDCISLTQKLAHAEHKEKGLHSYKHDPCNDFDLNKGIFNSRLSLPEPKEPLDDSTGVLIKYSLEKLQDDTSKITFLPEDSNNFYLKSKNEAIRSTILII